MGQESRSLWRLAVIDILGFEASNHVCLGSDSESCLVSTLFLRRWRFCSIAGQLP